jgi:cytochrome c-type biogenesis protein CcmH
VIGRRSFLALAATGALPRALRGQDTTATADRLQNPTTVGQPRAPLTALDNDPVVIAIERRLRCTCGCTLDVYTCRTTDFTCTFSPAMHKEVMDRRTAGEDPETIIAAFVAREGEAILMAPPAEGFDLVGYVVPGLAMMAGVVALVAWISRRRGRVAEAVPVAVDAAPIDDAERERLRRALDDVEA